ncbi:response regulator transcription factor [Methanohalophilus portucalensis]|uniref:Response regulator n=3 Tax=Methanohalophilus portucalensis TaxID=39664 RepID=A0A1X7NVV8_9EURY|nr:response regulator [Methanohalophilus portucalensis]ATU07850.1 two-component system response regulator [Methanohalophilus portucalensis]RNI11564.1 response regulator [Methanohalophilus portucalensis FDF-1]SMH41810.1 two-component system, OmpR family, response regulator VicR [Methanohalophilus portucalensis FDF-1]
MNCFGKKVLVVDDEAHLRDLLQNLLELNDISTSCASSGEECLLMLESSLPDLVLLDVMMPGMDGWEVFHRIKEKYEHLPVVLLTARNHDFDKMMGLDILKADDYITKPFDNDELVECVCSLLD